MNIEISLTLFLTWLWPYFMFGYVSASIITAKNESLFVVEQRNAVLKWVIAGVNNVSQTVECTIKNKDMQLATVRYDESSGKLLSHIPVETKNLLNQRLQDSVYIDTSLKTVFTLTIKQAVESDSGIYVCKSGQQSSEIKLKVYSELVEMSSLKSSPSGIIVTELCGTPEPRVTMYLRDEVRLVKGERKPNSNCFIYLIQNITLTDQKYCGEKLKLVYEGVVKTLRRSTVVSVPLKPREPTNAQIKISDNGDCHLVRWNGPNIGSCMSASLSYEVVVYRHQTVLKRMRTSSNVVEICKIDFLREDVSVKVRNIIDNQNSTWTQASVILDEKLYDGMQTAIIACSALAIFLLVLLTAYCCYFHKYRLKRICSREEKLLVKGDSEEEESKPLNDPKGQQQPQPQQEQKEHKENKTESKRKISRKISLDTLLNDSQLSNGTRKNSTGAGEQNKVNNAKPKAKPNHTNRFYSLQRNIEREKKKLVEQEQEQKEEESYTHRRNTDSRILQDLRNTFGEHQFGPRTAQEVPDARYSSNDERRSQQYSSDEHQGSPLYDVLPNTRSSASTNSTGGGPSFHEEDDHQPPARRRNTNEGLLSTEIDPAPLYDVLPRSNTNGMVPPPVAKRANNSAQVYDYVPNMKGRSPSNRLDQPNETIYDVPVKPTVSEVNTGPAATYMPFSSHKKQNHTQQNTSDIYENRTS